MRSRRGEGVPEERERARACGECRVSVVSVSKSPGGPVLGRRVFFVHGFVSVPSCVLFRFVRPGLFVVRSLLALLVAVLDGGGLGLGLGGSPLPRYYRYSAG